MMKTIYALRLKNIFYCYAKNCVFNLRLKCITLERVYAKSLLMGYALELFDINPLNFLVKPLSYEKIEKVINKYLKINDIQAGIFSYKYGHDTFQIMIKDIIYLKSKGKKIIIKLKNKEVDFYGSLEKVFHTQLKMYGFLFIHKSFVVNYSYVSIFEYERVILSDNTVLSIGQSKRKEIRKIQNELEIRRS